MVVSPTGHIFKMPERPLITVDVPANSYRLAMLGEYADAFGLVFDYSNLSISEVFWDDDLNLFGILETPKGDAIYPLIPEYWGADLGRLVEAVKNNIRLEV